MLFVLILGSVCVFFYKLKRILSLGTCDRIFYMPGSAKNLASQLSSFRIRFIGCSLVAWASFYNFVNYCRASLNVIF